MTPSSSPSLLPLLQAYTGAQLTWIILNGMLIPLSVLSLSCFIAAFTKAREVPSRWRLATLVALALAFLCGAWWAKKHYTAGLLDCGFLFCVLDKKVPVAPGPHLSLPIGTVLGLMYFFLALGLGGFCLIGAMHVYLER